MKRSHYPDFHYPMIFPIILMFSLFSCSTRFSLGKIQIPTMESIKDARLIFVGKVKKIGKPPRVATAGIAVSEQKVKYEVVKVIKGYWKSSEIIVAHWVPGFSRSNSAILNARFTGLSKTYFRRNTELIVFAFGVRPSWEDRLVDPVPATSQNLEIVTNLIGSSYER